MNRISHQLLGTLFVFGCGSGAYASPNHGQWFDPNSPDQSQATTQTQTPDQTAQAGPYQTPSFSPSDQSQADCSQQPDVTQNLNATPTPPDQSQSQAQPQDSQDQDDDSAAVAPSAGPPRLGIMVVPLTPELRRHFRAPADRGVLIGRIEPNAAASHAGLRVGDVLVRVGPRQVRSADDVIQALAAQGSGRIRLVAIRDGSPVRLDAFIPAQNARPDDDRL